MTEMLVRKTPFCWLVFI